MVCLSLSMINLSLSLQYCISSLIYQLRIRWGCNIHLIDLLVAHWTSPLISRTHFISLIEWSTLPLLADRASAELGLSIEGFIWDLLAEWIDDDRELSTILSWIIPGAPFFPEEVGLPPLVEADKLSELEVPESMIKKTNHKQANPLNPDYLQMRLSLSCDFMEYPTKALGSSEGWTCQHNIGEIHEQMQPHLPTRVVRKGFPQRCVCVKRLTRSLYRPNERGKLLKNLYVCIDHWWCTNSTPGRPRFPHPKSVGPALQLPSGALTSLAENPYPSNRCANTLRSYADPEKKEIQPSYRRRMFLFHCRWEPLASHSLARCGHLTGATTDLDEDGVSTTDLDDLYAALQGTLCRANQTQKQPSHLRHETSPKLPSTGAAPRFFGMSCALGAKTTGPCFGGVRGATGTTAPETGALAICLRNTRNRCSDHRAPGLCNGNGNRRCGDDRLWRTRTRTRRGCFGWHRRRCSRPSYLWEDTLNKIPSYDTAPPLVEQKDFWTFVGCTLREEISLEALSERWPFSHASHLWTLPLVDFPGDPYRWLTGHAKRLHPYHTKFRSTQAQITGWSGSNARRWCQSAKPGAHPMEEKKTARSRRKETTETNRKERTQSERGW